MGDLTWPIIRDKVDAAVTVPEADIVAAMRLAFERMKVMNFDLSYLFKSCASALRRGANRARLLRTTTVAKRGQSPSMFNLFLPIPFEFKRLCAACGGAVGGGGTCSGVVAAVRDAHAAAGELR